ncbi:MAG: hypothetical protein LW865_13095 [Betaproteobacteria bacterium]|jgi:hypothetical protein|nr:hypothetical protein [Betaproteobacteria bacterium]
MIVFSHSFRLSLSSVVDAITAVMPPRASLRVLASGPGSETREFCWLVGNALACVVVTTYADDVHPLQNPMTPQTVDHLQSANEMPAEMQLSIIAKDFSGDNWLDAAATFCVVNGINPTPISVFDGQNQRTFDETLIVELAPSETEGWQALKALGFVPASQAAFSIEARERCSFF